MSPFRINCRGAALCYPVPGFDTAEVRRLLNQRGFVNTAKHPPNLSWAEQLRIA